MVEYILTKEHFFKGVKQYLLKHWGSSVTPSDLWSALDTSQNLPTSLEFIMTTWTNEPGYPLVTVDCRQGVAELSQEPFSSTGIFLNNVTWWIPISYTTASQRNTAIDRRPKHWLAPGNTLTLPDFQPQDWILVNLEQSGFYRVNYDSDNWYKLMIQLHTDREVFSPLNRAALVDDSLTLAAAGVLDYSIALNITSYLSKETDFIVWRSVVRPLLRLADLLVNTPFYSMYKNYLLLLVDTVYNKSQLIYLPLDDHTDRVRRQIVVRLACENGNQHCKKAAESLMNLLMSGQEPRISVDSRDSLLCTGVRHGGDQVWEFITDLIKRNHRLTKELNKVLACTQQNKLFKRYLIESIPELSQGEWLRRVTTFAARRENVDPLIKLIHDNISPIVSRFGMKVLSNAVIEISKLLSTKEHNDMLADFERLGASGLEPSKRNIQDKITWLEKFAPSLISNLKNDNRLGLFLN